MKCIGSWLSALVLAFVGSGLLRAQEAARAKSPPVVRIGSKSFTEGVILGELITQLTKDAGADARHERELGGTQVVFKALVAGEIDAYPEYTGTLAAEILQDEPAKSDEQIRAALARRGIQMSRRLGFSNTYALGLKEDLAEHLQLKKISQLAEPRFKNLKLGFSDEFMNRGDGWPGLKRHHGLTFKPRGMDHNLAYRGLAGGSIDMTDLYSTDAEVQYYNLRLLEDDRGYFPQYYCVVLYRNDLAERAPQVIPSITRLEDQVQAADMVAMNKRAKIDRVPEARVAAEFLSGRFQIQVDLPEERPIQDLLESLLLTTGQHLFLVGLSLAAAVIVAIPLGIWAYKWPPLAHGILGVVGIIQTIPSMAVLVFMIPLLGLGAWPAIVALFLYSLLPIVRGTLSGLRDIPNHLKESAIVLGLSPRARLWLVELPIASRSILSGIKTAAVINVGTATIGALIGAGGYGQPILTGIRLDRIDLILQGAIPAAVLALLVQGLFDLAEPLVVPRGLRLATDKT